MAELVQSFSALDEATALAIKNSMMDGGNDNDECLLESLQESFSKLDYDEDDVHADGGTGHADGQEEGGGRRKGNLFESFQNLDDAMKLALARSLGSGFNGESDDEPDDAVALAMQNSMNDAGGSAEGYSSGAFGGEDYEYLEQLDEEQESGEDEVDGLMRGGLDCSARSGSVHSQAHSQGRGSAFSEGSLCGSRGGSSGCGDNMTDSFVFHDNMTDSFVHRESMDAVLNSLHSTEDAPEVTVDGKRGSGCSGRSRRKHKHKKKKVKERSAVEFVDKPAPQLSRLARRQAQQRLDAFRREGEEAENNGDDNGNDNNGDNDGGDVEGETEEQRIARRRAQRRAGRGRGDGAPRAGSGAASNSNNDDNENGGNPEEETEEQRIARRRAERRRLRGQPPSSSVDESSGRARGGTALTNDNRACREDNGGDEVPVTNNDAAAGSNGSNNDNNDDNDNNIDDEGETKEQKSERRRKEWRRAKGGHLSSLIHSGGKDRGKHEDEGGRRKDGTNEEETEEQREERRKKRREERRRAKKKEERRGGLSRQEATVKQQKAVRRASSYTAGSSAVSQDQRRASMTTDGGGDRDDDNRGSFASEGGRAASEGVPEGDDDRMARLHYRGKTTSLSKIDTIQEPTEQRRGRRKKLTVFNTKLFD